MKEGKEMFNKFTERARKVLTLAQEEAARLGHDYVGTEHMLLDWFMKVRAWLPRRLAR